MGLFCPGFVDQTWDLGAPCPPWARLAHHPEEARPVFRHMQFWIHSLQEPLEVLTLELGTELPPLCHVPKRLLRKQQNDEALQVTVLPIKAPLSTDAHACSEILLSTYCVLGPVQGTEDKKTASDIVAAC